MTLSNTLRIAINELRVQMLGTEVLFGFQLEGTFNPGFSHLSSTARAVDALAMTGILLALAAMIGAPAQHRLVERGNVSQRLLQVIGHLAAAALLSLALVLGCDGFIVSERFVGTTPAALIASATFAIALGLWFALGWWYKPRQEPPHSWPVREDVPMREKIEQMLYEAWVILPGATGILGFQLRITFLEAFEGLSQTVRTIHFTALTFIVLSLILLLTPAALHRKAFSGKEDPRSLVMGSRIVGLALAPLSIGLALDFYVAIGRMVGYGWLTGLGSLGILMLLWSVWYVAPWLARRPDQPATELTR